METWAELKHQWERLRWARMRAGFDRTKDAADSLGIKPGTYRTYEVGKADGGREPTLSDLRRISKKFKVNWIWVATGDGDPEKNADPRLEVIARKVESVPTDKQDDALSAVMGVLDAYQRKAG